MQMIAKRNEIQKSATPIRHSVCKWPPISSSLSLSLSPSLFLWKNDKRRPKQHDINEIFEFVQIHYVSYFYLSLGLQCFRKNESKGIFRIFEPRMEKMSIEKLLHTELKWNSMKIISYIQHNQNVQDGSSGSEETFRDENGMRDISIK